MSTLLNRTLNGKNIISLLKLNMHAWKKKSNKFARAVFHGLTCLLIPCHYTFITQ